MTQTTTEWEEPIMCACGNDVNKEHHNEGFGHQFVCCRCYEIAMGVPVEIVDRKNKK